MIGYDYMWNYMETAVGIATFFLIMLVVLGLALIAAWYFIYCYPLQSIANKCGITDKNWMAYLPVARSILKTEIADMSPWKSIFLGWFTPTAATWFVTFLIRALFIDVAPSFVIIMNFLIWLSVTVFRALINYQYNYRLCKIFGFKTVLAFFMLFVPLFEQFFQFMIVFASQIRANKECLYGAEHTVDYRGRYDGYDDQGYQEPGFGQSYVSPAIVGKNGTFAGQRLDFAAGETIMLGRDKNSCSVVFPPECIKVSRVHCSITYDSARCGYLIVDMSSNGTFVNGMRLKPNSPYLGISGNVIKIGNDDNTFVLA